MKGVVAMNVLEGLVATNVLKGPRCPQPESHTAGLGQLLKGAWGCTGSA